MVDYLNAIAGREEYIPVYGYLNYLNWFHYLALVEEEALLRSPNAPQSEAWRWDLAYHVAMTPSYVLDVNAPELPLYAKLIEDGLNSGETDIGHLSEWFGDHENRLSVQVTPYGPIAGYQQAFILKLASAYLWAYQSSDQYQVEGIISSLFYFRGEYSEQEFFDVTGDQENELNVKTWIPNCCGEGVFNNIFDFSTGHPRELIQVSGVGESRITPKAGPQGAGFVFEDVEGDPVLNPCNLRQFQTYKWNGAQFDLADESYEIEPPDEYDDKELCNFVIQTAVEPVEKKIAVQVLSKTEAYPPETEPAQNIILFRLGEYYARTGDWEKAQQFFTQQVLRTKPADQPTSEYFQSAKKFLDLRPIQKDFYRVCAKIKKCNTGGAITQILRSSPAELFPIITNVLKEVGVTVLSSGYGDFDSDPAIEQWVVIQHPGKSEKEFWIIDKKDETIDCNYFTTVTSSKPVVNIYSTYGSGDPVIQIEGKMHRAYLRVPEKAKESYLEQTLDDSENELLTGQDPALIRSVLMDIEKSGSLKCAKGLQCERLQYLLGLANELSGDQQKAVEYYFRLCVDDPGSPYAILARLNSLNHHKSGLIY